MAMYFRFHIYARKSQNYPGSGLGFGNNFFAHNWHYQQKIFVCVLLVVQQNKATKNKNKKSNQKRKGQQIMKKKLTQKQINRIEWAQTAGFDFSEFEKVLSKTERRLQTKSQNKKWFEKINRFYLKAYMAFTYGNCSKEQKEFYENILFRCLAHYRKYAKAAYTWMSLEKDA